MQKFSIFLGGTASDLVLRHVTSISSTLDHGNLGNLRVYLGRTVEPNSWVDCLHSPCCRVQSVTSAPRFCAQYLPTEALSGRPFFFPNGFFLRRGVGKGAACDS